MRSILKRQKGQGMTEYVILVALIAVGLITAVIFFREALVSAFHRITAAIGII